ncbi:LbtU family siderophore porin [Thiotrichales bacterium 19S9-12]|nr:LbtU family siderophore porin [Thiotrichales bacterium 19S9-11]MCF6811573.1 LbtU family siderophore porin [Thiotrichales bacterium 19S9-12]
MLKKLLFIITISSLPFTYAVAENTSIQKEKEQQSLIELQQEIDLLKHDITNNDGYLRHVIYDANSVDHIYLEGLSSSTRALSLLQARDRFDNNTLVLGGEIEFDSQVWYGDEFRANENQSTADLSNGSGIFLTTVNIDFLYNIGQWLQVYIEVLGSQDGSNVDVSGESASVTIGNLDKTPFFATVGKNRPMYGTLPGAPWASSIEQGLFRPGYINNITLGYNKDNLTANFTYINASANHDTFIADTFYTYPISKTQLKLGGNLGYVNDINGTGMGIASTPNNDKTRTPAINVEGQINWKTWTFYSGWASTMRENKALDSNGLSGVWYLQGAYEPILFGKPTLFSISYAQSYNMSNVYFPSAANAGNSVSIIGPKRQIYAFISRTIIDAFILSIEYAWIKTFNNQENNTITLDTTIYF